jgi:hypothetical protein
MAEDADRAKDAHEAKNAAMAGNAAETENAYVAEDAAKDAANVTHHDHVEDVLLHGVVSRCEGAADDVTRHHGDDNTGVVTRC